MGKFSIITGIVIVATVLIGTLSSMTIYAQAEPETIVYSWYLDTEYFIPCANGGAGEVVQVTGYNHAVFHTTVDGTGGYHTKVHYNGQGLRGLGSVTGDRYNNVGVTQDHFNGKVGEQYTFVQNFRMIGQGKASNWHLDATVHVTVDANGTLTADVERYNHRCD